MHSTRVAKLMILQSQHVLLNPVSAGSLQLCPAAQVLRNGIEYSDVSK